MDSKETFGDGWEVLDAALQGLSGDLGVSEGGTSFPVMDSPPMDEEDVEEEKNTDGFKDERTVKEEQEVVLKDNSEDIDQEELKKKENDISEKLDEKAEETAETEEKKDTPEDEDLEDVGFGELEPDLAEVIQEKLFEEMGWEFGDDDKKFESIADAVQYMKQVVDANSKPEFASDELKKLNKFVEDGGNIKDYFDVQGELDLENIDLDQEYNQRLVVKETLKARGLTDSQADKKIKRYEETGILEDEALDSKDFLQKDKKEKADKLLKEQTLVREQAEKQQQKFYSDVESYIDSLTDINGIKLTNVQKNKLKNATLKVGLDGKTEYQKKYQDNLIKNFIKSAFFTLQEDTIIKNLERKAESRATKNLKKRLETNTKRGKSTGLVDEQGSSNKTDHSSLNMFGSFIKP